MTNLADRLKSMGHLIIPKTRVVSSGLVYDEL